MKKLICTNLLFALSLNLLAPSLIHCGRGKFQKTKNCGSNRYRKRDKYSLKTNKFVYKSRKKEKRYKSKQRKKIEELNKKIQDRIYNKLDFCKTKNFKKCGKGKHKDYDVTTYSPRAIYSRLIVLLILLPMLISSGYSMPPYPELPPCIAGPYPLSVENAKFWHNHITLCYCRVGFFGDEYLDCNLELPVPELECESNMYDIKVKYIEGITLLSKDAPCFCEPMDGGNDLAILNCNSPFAKFEIVPAICTAKKRRSSDLSLDKPCCDAILTTENNETTITTQCYPSQEVSNINLELIPIWLTLGLVLGACLTACPIGALCAIKKGCKKRKKITKVEKEQPVELEDKNKKENIKTQDEKTEEEIETESETETETETDTDTESDTSTDTEIY
ncbi:hypothetical protein ACFLYU_00070 [Candidatus Dependentiae bacterium]